MEALIVICAVGSATALVVSLANWRITGRLMVQVRELEGRQRLAGREELRRRNARTDRLMRQYAFAGH